MTSAWRLAGVRLVARVRSRRSVGLWTRVSVFACVLGVLVWTAAVCGAQPYEAYESAVAASGPVVQYRFSDAAGSSTLVDSAGSDTASNDGIALGGVGPFEGGKSGQFKEKAYASLAFDPLAGASAFTVELWADRGSGASHVIFDLGSSAKDHMYLSPGIGGEAVFEIRTSESTGFEVKGASLTAGSWEYVAVTETSSGVLTLYENGERVGQTTGVTISPSSLGNTPDNYLGRPLVSTDYYLNGSLSNVAFYTKALTAEQVRAHYDAAEHPFDTSPPSISGTVQQGKTLTAAAGSWSGVEPITFAYQWLRCSSVGGECREIGAATNKTYTLVNEDAGHMLRVAVTGTNAAGKVSAESSLTVPVKGVKPSNSSLPVVSGSVEDGRLLSVSSGVWSGTTPMSYAYEWEMCNNEGAACKHVSGAASASYRVSNAQKGGTLRAIVAASNVAGSAKATSAKTAVVAAGAPLDVSRPGIFGMADAGLTVYASTGAWAGSEPFSYAYQWQLCSGTGESCSAISGAVGSSYALNSGEVGGTLRVVVVARNSVGQEEVASSPSAVVAAPPPVNTGLPSIEGSAREGASLIVSAGGWSGVEPFSYAYQWQRCSTQPLGSEGSANGQFERPGDVVVDSSGNLWVVDTGNDRIEEFNGQGEYMRQFGSEGSGDEQLSEPSALAIGPGGDVWVADTGNDRVEEFSPSGEYIMQIDPAESESDHLEEPEGIAVDRDGDVWVSDTYEGELVEFSSEGEYLRTVGSEGSGPGQLGEPEGLAVDQEGHVWVADWSNDRVEEFNEQGEYLREFGSKGSGAGQLEGPYGVAVGASGHVWVGDVEGDRVEEFNERGEYLRQFGAPGAAAGQFGLSYPMGFASVSNGDLWLTDAENDRLERFNGQGEYLGSSCVNILGGTGSGYSPTPADVGSVLEVAVSAEDAEGRASVTSSPSAVVAPAPPVNTRPPVIEGVADEGQTLTASIGGWSGSSLTYAFQWQSCNRSGEGCANIEGADGSTYIIGAGEIGRTLRVRVSAENASGKVTVASSPTAAIAAGPPINTSLPVIEGVTKEGQTLIASFGGWLGTAPLGYFFQWMSCDALGEGCSAIPGAVSSSYRLSPSDVGTTLEVTVTVTNAVGAGSATSQRTAVVTSGRLENTALPVITGTAAESRTLTVSTGYWLGVEPITYSYQWQRCVPGLIGSVGNGNGQFERPGDVVVDSSGDLWVADTGNDRIEEFNEKGEYMRQFGSAGWGDGQLDEPSALAVGAGGDIWVADRGNDRVEEFSPTGEYLRHISTWGGESEEEGAQEQHRLEAPEGIAIDRDGDVWVSDTANGELVEFNEEGEYLKTVGSEGSLPGQFGEPEGVAVDSQGHVWVADSANDRVEEFNEQGEYLRQFGSEGSGAGQLESPFGIAAGANGRVWVGDVGNERVEEFGEHGEYIGQFGVEGSAPGQLDLSFPMGLAVLPDGALWLTDTANDRLERFNEHGEYLSGQCSAIPGATNASYSPSAADVGMTLQAVVTAEDAEGNASATSSPTAVVAP